MFSHLGPSRVGLTGDAVVLRKDQVVGVEIKRHFGDPQETRHPPLWVASNFRF
jgi:hypothetical protein